MHHVECNQQVGSYWIDIYEETSREGHSGISGPGHEDTTFFQQNGAGPHTVNVAFDFLHDVFGSRFLERFGYGWLWPPCSPDIPAIISFGLLQRSCVPHQPAHRSRVAAGNETITEEIPVTGCMTQLTILWFVYRKSPRSKNLILNMCSKEG